MPRQSRQIRTSQYIFAMTALAVFAVVGCGKMFSSAGHQNPADVIDPKDPRFTVPDGKPAVILEFVKELQSRRPQFTSQQEELDYMIKSQKALIRAGDKILTLEAEDSVLRDAVSIKLMATLAQASQESERKTAGSDDLAKEALASVNGLREDNRKIVAETADDFWLAARALNLGSLPPDEQTQLADEAMQIVLQRRGSMASVRDAGFLAGQFLKLGQVESAATLYDRLAVVLELSKDAKTKTIAGRLRGNARRLRLPGSQLEIEGRLLDGGDLDWKSYRGKIVLVDFWATWCGPCVEEIPHVKAAYEKYHSRGFDVVGISLDREQKDLQNFLMKQPLPWVQLFDNETSKASGWLHPMSERYSISAIPAAYLVDKEGKVISMEARGEELDRLLEKLLGSE